MHHLNNWKVLASIRHKKATRMRRGLTSFFSSGVIPDMEIGNYFKYFSQTLHHVKYFLVELSFFSLSSLQFSLQQAP